MKRTFPCEQSFVDYLAIERGLTERSIEAYCIDLRVFAGYMDERAAGWDVAGVTDKHVRGFLGYLKKERDNGPITRNRKLASLRSYFQFLELEGHIREATSPTRRLRDVKTSRTLPVFLNQADGEALLSGAKMDSRYPERDYALIQFFLQTGCRLNEVVQMELDHLHLGEGYVRVRGKGGRERFVPLTESTCRALEAYLVVRSPKVQTKRVFLSHRGIAISRRGVQELFERICKKAGVEREKLSVHKLRHTCLTLLMKAGVNLVTLQEIAGHENISTTGIYVHVTRNEVRAAMEKHPLG
ncbi:MAG: tyrosine-type recombinase/integrase [Bacillota bacterium]|nr:tyrosine-type recombinase/integrase [Bacillota bacterium]